MVKTMLEGGVTGTGCWGLRPALGLRVSPVHMAASGPHQLTWPARPARACKRGSSVARLRPSAQQAVEELFNACYPRLAGWVRRLVDDEETAHEIASEAFTRLLSRWSGLDNPQSYLYMIATNLVRDHWRKPRRGRSAIPGLAAPGPARPPPPPP